MRLITADWVVPVASAPIPGGAVLLDDARIVDLGPAEQVLPRCPTRVERRDLGACAVLPGLVNAHCHLEYTVWGDALAGLPYVEWIRELVRTKSEALSDDDLLASSRWGAGQLLRYGVTSVGEQTARDVSVAALAEAGLGGVAHLEVFGRDPERAQGDVSALFERVERAREVAGPRLRIGVTPHTPWTSGPQLIQGVARLARAQGLPLAIHAAESPAEMEFVARGTGPLSAPWKRDGVEWSYAEGTPVEYLDALGFWEGPVPVQAVHLVHATPRDWDLLASRGAAIALCPRSNLSLAVGYPPIQEARQAGLPVGLGTDSRASAFSLSPWDEARAARDVSRRTGSSVGTRELLEWMTLGAARSLGIQDVAGVLKPGRPADLAVFRLPPVPCTDPVEAILDMEETVEATLVIAGGRVVRDAAESESPASPPEGALRIHERILRVLQEKP